MHIGTGYAVAELSCMGTMRVNGIVTLPKRAVVPAPGNINLQESAYRISGVPIFFQDKLEIKILLYNLKIF